MTAARPVNPEQNPQTFAARWRGKFKPAERDDPRYNALAKKYLG